MASREFAARGIVRGTATGPALVSTEAISFLGDLDIRSGKVVRKSHPLVGVSLKGTVLVLPHSVGSAGAWRFLYQLFVHHTNPVAIVQKKLPDSSLVQGAILAKIPIVCEMAEDILTLIHTGDLVEVDGTNGLVRVTAAAAAPA
ncbi:MAG: aconitase X swivel domain-containing protein [Candidatus Limnocylindria bacterium]